jgi:hypothetical protein
MHQVDKNKSGKPDQKPTSKPAGEKPAGDKAKSGKPADGKKA